MGYGAKNTGSKVKIIRESAAIIYKWKVVQYEWLVTTTSRHIGGLLDVTGRRMEVNRTVGGNY